MSGAIASTDSFSQGAVDQTLHNLSVTFYGSWTQNANATEYVRWGFDWGLGSSFSISGPHYTADNSFGFIGDESFQLQNSYTYILGHNYGYWVVDQLLLADVTYGFRTHLDRYH